MVPSLETTGCNSHFLSLLGRHVSTVILPHSPLGLPVLHRTVVVKAVEPELNLIFYLLLHLMN